MLENRRRKHGLLLKYSFVIILPLLQISVGFLMKAPTFYSDMRSDNYLLPLDEVLLTIHVRLSVFCIARGKMVRLYTEVFVLLLVEIITGNITCHPGGICVENVTMW